MSRDEGIVRKQSIIFGGGNIGRGFVGQLFSESDYSVTFVDVDTELVDALNQKGSYHLQTVSNDHVRDFQIGPVRAIYGKDLASVAKAVAEATLGATAVGAGALTFIAPAMAAGIALRAAAKAPPLNFIICENLKGAAAHVRNLVGDHIAAENRNYFETSVGFVDTVIGRMVPMPTAKMRARDVSFIRVEPYKELPVDKAGFVGRIPEIVAMEAHEHFPIFTARKLYIHNCGHALLAYAGYLKGHEMGYQALANPEVKRILEGGLYESVAAIVAEYGADQLWLEDHVADLMGRFANRALADTTFRLGRDPIRKLAANDRLVGAANLACKNGRVPPHLSWGIAAALLFDPPDDPSAQELQDKCRNQGTAAAMQEITGIVPTSELGKLVLKYVAILRENAAANFPA